MADAVEFQARKRKREQAGEQDRREEDGEPPQRRPS